MIEVIRGRSQRNKPTLLVIDGVQYRMEQAAAVLRTTKHAIQRRIHRGVSLVKPFKRHVFD